MQHIEIAIDFKLPFTLCPRELGEVTVCLIAFPHGPNIGARCASAHLSNQA
jgi:hypothetical protein